MRISHITGEPIHKYVLRDPQRKWRSRASSTSTAATFGNAAMQPDIMNHVTRLIECIAHGAMTGRESDFRDVLPNAKVAICRNLHPRLGSLTAKEKSMDKVPMHEDNACIPTLSSSGGLNTTAYNIEAMAEPSQKSYKGRHESLHISVSNSGTESTHADILLFKRTGIGFHIIDLIKNCIIVTTMLSVSPLLSLWYENKFITPTATIIYMCNIIFIST